MTTVIKKKYIACNAVQNYMIPKLDDSEIKFLKYILNSK